MESQQWLADRFEEHRPRLHALAYRMLGSLSDADDAVQDAWIRWSGTTADQVTNVGAWLTTIVSRVCLNQLRTRNRRPEDPLGVRLPDPVVRVPGLPQPDEEALLADSVSMALLIVLATLSPAERVAFVLHDTFDVPFDQIAPVVGRSPAAARQLASRARRRVQDADIPTPDSNLAEQRHIVDAFFRAARAGDFRALVRALHPDVRLYADAGTRRPGTPALARGSTAVARQALAFAVPTAELLPVVANGSAAVIVLVNGSPVSVMTFTVTARQIMAIHAIAGRQRLRRIASTVVGRRG